MKETGKGKAVNKGMYLNGEISINDCYSVNQRRDTCCKRCTDFQIFSVIALHLKKEKKNEPLY